jgi:hypothetical protein
MELTEEEIRELEAFDDEEFDEGDGGTEVVYYRGGDSDEEDEEEGDEDEEEDGEYEDEEEVEIEEEEVVVQGKKGRPVEVYDDEEEEEKAKRSGARNDPEWQFFDTARIYVKGGDGGTWFFFSGLGQSIELGPVVTRQATPNSLFFFRPWTLSPSLVYA